MSESKQSYPGIGGETRGTELGNEGIGGAGIVGGGGKGGGNELGITKSEVGVGAVGGIGGSGGVSAIGLKANILTYPETNNDGGKTFWRKPFTVVFIINIPKVVKTVRKSKLQKKSGSH